ncbi:MAG: type II secretion system F family protein [Candidatus Brocadiia bacterium]
MPKFKYIAVDDTGRETTGTVVADSRSGALEEVEGRALHPVSVDEAAPASAGLSLGRAGRVPQASVDSFTRELANLLEAGVPLNRALSLLAEEAGRPAARRCWEEIREDVVGGMALADAMARWPRVFPPVYVAMVRAGEAGGFLEKVLEQIADFRQRERDLKGRVTAAMVYPTVLAVLAVLVMAFLLTYFIPRFSGVFAEFGGRLPWLTRAIVATSDFFAAHGLTVLLVLGVAGVLGHRLLNTDGGRRFVERVTLSIPAVGTVVSRFALVRFCRMLGTLLSAGVPLVAALAAAREAIGNQTLSDTVTRAVDEVQRGAPLARSLRECPELFTPSVLEMVSVGEETGRLDRELVRLAETYEAELDRRLRMLVALAEPALLFVMAALIGTVVIGMLLPVFTLQELIR